MAAIAFFAATVGGYGKTYGLDDHQVPSDLFDWLSAGLVDKVCTYVFSNSELEHFFLILTFF